MVYFHWSLQCDFLNIERVILMAEMCDYPVIFGNDEIESADNAIDVSRLAGPHVDAIKIGLTTSALKENFGLITRIKGEAGKVVIADFKVADIGFTKDGRWEGTDSKIVRAAARAGADYITCHMFPGTSSIQECIDTAHANGVKVLTLPFMTGKGADLFFGQPIDKEYSSGVLQKLGIDVDLSKCEKMHDLILLIGNALDVDGYIGPANNPDVLRRYRELTHKPIYGPGVGRQSKLGNTEEQLKIFYEICGPKSGVIIASSIYDPTKPLSGQDPAKSAAEFKEYRDRAVRSLKRS